MSDLFGGSGPSGSRGATEPGQTSTTATGANRYAHLKAPTDVMRERRARDKAREERKQAEAAAAQQQTRVPASPNDQAQRGPAQRRQEGITPQIQQLPSANIPGRDSGYRSAEAGASAGGYTPASQVYATPTTQQPQPPIANTRLKEYDRYTPPPPSSQPAEHRSADASYGRAQQPTYPTSSSRVRTTVAPQNDPKLAPTSHPQAMPTSSTPRTTLPQSQGQPVRPSPATGPTPVSQQVQQANNTQAVIPGPTGEASGRQARNSNASSFPHAFERWENLSSRWEGLTSYWIRKLETNPQKADINQEMARQITDLAAGGANLFHAVIELQRLRASSERKFQRWFFETREQHEEYRENIARLERNLDEQRHLREDAEATVAATRNRGPPPEQQRNYDRLLAEYKRELQISKEEARRAWEDLGRQEQIERERIQALREGNRIYIGGIQVVPHSAAGHGDNFAQRPATQQATAAPPGPEYERSPRVPQEYDAQGSSPTNTDPFSSGERQAIIRPPAGNARVYQQQQQPAIPTRASSRPQETAQIPRTAPRLPSAPSQPSQAPTTSRSTGTSPSSRFYTPQQGAAVTASISQSAAPASTAPYLMSSTTPQAFSGSETEDEPDWEVDSSGHVRLDAAGNPIIARYPSHRSRRRTHEEGEDSGNYDLIREQYQAISAAPTAGGSYVHSAGTVSGGQPSYVQTAEAHGQAQAAEVVSSPSYTGQFEQGRPGAPDYEGAGYEGDDAEWQAVPQSSHHHPTRLSDVPEEDERSRGSLPSAGRGQSGAVSGSMF